MTASYVKWQAYMPSGAPLSMSAYHRTPLARNDIIEIGKRVAHNGNKTLHAWGEFRVAVVWKARLETDYNDDPKYHVDVLGWPEEKSERVSLAQLIAKHATIQRPI